MTATEPYSVSERRKRDRSAGIQLRRRESQQVEDDRRTQGQNGVDIAAALELYLDQAKTRRAMIGLLESWLADAQGIGAAHDEGFIEAVKYAIHVMGESPDPQTAIAVLQRR